MPQLNIDVLRGAVAQNWYVITAHAKQRMGHRRVTDRDLQRVVATGDVIEEHQAAQPFPKALFMAYVHEEPLYVSCAFDGQTAYIITVHWYDPSVWIDPWTRRKA